MVAITSGRTPAWRSRVTRSFRTPKPRRSVDARMVARSATANGSRSTIQKSTIANAGRTTNSPCAKLIALEVCQSRTKPMAVMA